MRSLHHLKRAVFDFGVPLAGFGPGEIELDNSVHTLCFFG